MSKSLLRSKKVEHIDREPDGTYFVWMNGYTIDPVASKQGNGQHCFGADTIREARQTLSTAVPCTGSCCKKNQRGKARQ